MAHQINKDSSQLYENRLIYFVHNQEHTGSILGRENGGFFKDKIKSVMNLGYIFENFLDCFLNPEQHLM